MKVLCPGDGAKSQTRCQNGLRAAVSGEAGGDANPGSVRPRGLYPARLLCPWNFSSQEHWSGLPFPPPEDLLDLLIDPTSPVPPAWQANSLPLNHLGSPLPLVKSVALRMSYKRGMAALIPS